MNNGSFKKFQTFSVAGGSKGKSLLDVFQDALHRRVGAHDFAGIISLQLFPFRPQALYSEFKRDIQQEPEPRPEQCCTKINGIAGCRVRPNQPPMFVPEFVERTHS